MKKLAFIFVVGLFLGVGAVSAQEPTEVPAEVNVDTENTTVETSAPPVVVEAEDQDVVTPFITTVIGAIVGALGVYLRYSRGVVNTVLNAATESLKDTPLGFLDIKDLADDFVRAALNHGGLSTHQEQVDFAVKGIENIVARAETALGKDLSFLKVYIRPAVNAAFSRIAFEIADELESIPEGVKHFVKA